MLITVFIMHTDRQENLICKNIRSGMRWSERRSTSAKSFDQMVHGLGFSKKSSLLRRVDVNKLVLSGTRQDQETTLYHYRSSPFYVAIAMAYPTAEMMQRSCVLPF